MAKRKTNDQRLKALIKDVCDSHPLMAVVLVERLGTISKSTRHAIEKDPKSFDNFIFNHTFFLEVCNKIDQHLEL